MCCYSVIYIADEYTSRACFAKGTERTSSVMIAEAGVVLAIELRKAFFHKVLVISQTLMQILIGPECEELFRKPETDPWHFAILVDTIGTNVILVEVQVPHVFHIERLACLEVNVVRAD